MGPYFPYFVNGPKMYQMASDFRSSLISKTAFLREKFSPVHLKSYNMLKGKIYGMDTRNFEIQDISTMISINFKLRSKRHLIMKMTNI